MNLLRKISVSIVMLSMIIAGKGISGEILKLDQNRTAPVSPFIIGTSDFAVEVSPDGRIAGLVLKRDGSRRAVSGETRLAGCAIRGPVAARVLPDGGVEFEMILAVAWGNSCRLI